MQVTNTQKGPRGLNTKTGTIILEPGESRDGIEISSEEMKIAQGSGWFAFDGEMPENVSFLARHKGGGSYSIFDHDDKEVLDKLSKDDAEAFNAMSDEDKATYVAAHKALIMPYTVPTLQQFRDKFPSFASVSDGTVNAALAEAGDSVDTTWIEKDYQPAILYLAAHILVTDGALVAASGLGSAGGIVGAGMVSEMKVGDVQVKLSDGFTGSGSGSGGSRDDYGSTAFGARFLTLMRRNFPAVAVV